MQGKLGGNQQLRKESLDEDLRQTRFRKMKEKYQVIERISEGNFGTVYKVKEMKSSNSILNISRSDTCDEEDRIHDEGSNELHQRNRNAGDDSSREYRSDS